MNLKKPFSIHRYEGAQAPRGVNTLAEDSAETWTTRYEQWLRYVEKVVRTFDAGGTIALGPSPALLVPPAVPAGAVQPRVVVCAPHPDDEALIGALPLRLRLETGARVIDCAVTLGSDVGQRARRRRELESACRVLGFDLVVPVDPSGVGPSGFDNVNPRTRASRPEEWAAKVETLRAIFDREKPDVVFAPHAEDFNTTHIGTHFLVVEALTAHLERSGRGPLPFVETEFWHQLAEPNLLVGVTPEVLAILLMAAAEHAGEMARNPYHLRQPGRMMDNVRRGSEVVGGQGAAAQNFAFAELYRVTFIGGVRGRQVLAPRPGGRMLGPTESIDVAAIAAEFSP